MEDKIVLSVNGEQKTLTFFKSINTLPIKRYQLIQKYALIDAGIGSSLSDVMRHFKRLDQFIEAKDWESVVIERENMLMSYQFILNSNFTKSYVFAGLIQTIDGVVVDVNDDNIDDYVAMLESSDIDVKNLDSLIEFQKKSLVQA